MLRKTKFEGFMLGSTQVVLIELLYVDYLRSRNLELKWVSNIGFFANIPACHDIKKMRAHLLRHDTRDYPGPQPVADLA